MAFVVENLDTDTEFRFDVFAINSVGRGDGTFVDIATVTTTTTTTTIDPNGVDFIMDFQGDVTDCFIGNDSITGAGSVVTKDIGSFVTVVGNPAKILDNSKNQ